MTHLYCCFINLVWGVILSVIYAIVCCFWCIKLMNVVAFMRPWWNIPLSPQMEFCHWCETTSGKFLLVEHQWKRLLDEGLYVVSKVFFLQVKHNHVMRKKALEISFKQKCALEFFDVLAAMLLCFLACDNLALNWFANYPNTAKVCAVRSGCSHVRATPLSCCKNLLSLLKNKQTRSCLSTQQIQMMMITFLTHALTKQK